MKDYKSVELYYEPRKFFRDEKYVFEMSVWESAFLCGLIKELKPRKIVEVGVAEGATSALIQKCMDLIGIDNYEMYSIDVSTTLWHDDSKKTGYCVDIAQKQGIINNFARHDYYGTILPDVIEEIGLDIDLIVLDTVHSHPGELLDTILCIPFMKNPGGVICWHDLALDHEAFRQEKRYVNKMCFDVIAGEKYYHMFGDPEGKSNFSNIGAVQVNQATIDSMVDLISALSYPWAYIPEEKALMSYRREYKKILEKNFLSYFDGLVELQKSTYKMNLKQSMEAESKITDNIRAISSVIESCDYYIFGAGSLGNAVLSYARQNIERMKMPLAFLISDEYSGDFKRIDNIPIKRISSASNAYPVIYASSFLETKKKLETEGFEIIEISKEVYQKFLRGYQYV